MEARRPQNDHDDAVRKCHANLVWEHRLLWLLLIAILGLWGYHFAIGRVDRQLRGEILKKLSDRFPKHLVQLDRAHLEEGKAILLEGLEISLPTAEGPREVLRIQRVLLAGPIELVRLLQGQVKVHQVRVDGLEVSLWPIDSERWSIQSLSGSEGIPDNLPPIDLRSGFVRVGGPSVQDEEFICHDLKGTARILGIAPNSAPRIAPINGRDSVPMLALQGSIASGHFKRIDVNSQVSLDKKTWTIAGSIEELDVSDRLLAMVPKSIQQRMISAKGLDCRGNVSFRVQHQMGVWTYDLQGRFRDGRLEHPQVPYRLDNLKGDLYCSNGLVQIRNVEAKAGTANFQLAVDIHHLESTPTAIIKSKINDLNLDGQLYRAIPEGMRSTWDKLGVSGMLDADVEVLFDGKQWRPKARVFAKDVALQPDIFPYPLTKLRGEFLYENDVIQSTQVTALANGKKVWGTLRLEKAAPRWLLDLLIESEAVAIDPALIGALTPRGARQTGLERFVRSLQPSGYVQVNQARFIRAKANPEVLSKSIELQFYSGSVHYSEFRYLIDDVQGLVTVDNDVIRLSQFQGRHDSARITCFGGCICNESRLDDLQLEFDAKSVPLQESLHRALPASVRELWNQAQPSGVLDQVRVLVARKTSKAPLDVRVTIDEEEPAEAQSGTAVSLRPTMMPYLLNDLSFHLDYSPGMLNVEMKGKHDFSSFVQSEATCRLREDGSWSCFFRWLPDTRINVDQSLLIVLPEQLQRPLQTLDYRGPVHIGGTTTFVTDPASGQPRVETWELDLAPEDGKLAGGSVAAGIRGLVKLDGVATPNGPVAIGELQLDALAIRGVPVQNLTGRFAILGDRLLFGREASQVVLPEVVTSVAEVPTEGVQLASALIPKRTASIRPSRRLMASPSLVLPPVKAPFPTPPMQPNDIQAQSLSGRVFAYGVGQLDTGRVSLQMHLDNAEFRNLMLDLGMPPGEASGKLYVDAQLHGSLQNLKTLSGGGIVRLREGKLYELPFMVRLLRMMNIRAPNSGAFESADIRFRVDGDRFPLEEIALDGDIISMRGEGWANARREIEMDLYTYVGPRGQMIAMLGPLIGKNTGATGLRVLVEGTTDNPRVSRSFVGLDKTTLEQIFPHRVSNDTQVSSATPQK